MKKDAFDKNENTLELMKVMKERNIMRNILMNGMKRLNHFLN